MYVCVYVCVCGGGVVFVYCVMRVLQFQCPVFTLSIRTL